MYRLYHRIRLFTRIISAFSELYQHLSVSDAAFSQPPFPWPSLNTRRSLCTLCPLSSSPALARLGRWLAYVSPPPFSVFKGAALRGRYCKWGCSTLPLSALKRSHRCPPGWVSSCPCSCYRCKNGFSMYSAVLYSSYSPGPVYRLTLWIRRNSAAYVAGDSYCASGYCFVRHRFDIM